VAEEKNVISVRTSKRIRTTQLTNTEINWLALFDLRLSRR
jgi:hypothetical protein